MYLKKLGLIAALFLIFAACRKGELPDEKYFGSVSYSAAQLPGTPGIEVKFDGKLIDSITGVQTGSTVLQAGTSGKLGFYVAGTDSLIADTLITILPNKTQSFRVISSADLGISGILPPVTSINPDTLYVQVYLNLSDYYNRDVIDFDLSMVGPSPPTPNLIHIALLKGMKNKELYPTMLRLRSTDPADGRSIRYTFAMKDPATGEAIPAPRPFFLFAGGSATTTGSFIAYVSDNNGMLTSRLIEL